MKTPEELVAIFGGKHLCTVFTEIQIDRKIKKYLVKGIDYVITDKNEIKIIMANDEWRKPGSLYGNWEKYNKISNIILESGDAVLKRLNGLTVDILTNELYKQEPINEADQKLESEADEIRAYGAEYHIEGIASKKKNRIILTTAINELKSWYRHHNIDFPSLKLKSQIAENSSKTIIKSKKANNKTELSGIYFQMKERYDELINEFTKKQGKYGSAKYANETIANKIWKEHKIEVTPKAVSTAMRYK